MVPESYKKLLKSNPKLESIKWSQYFSIKGDFIIDDVEFSGELTKKELDKLSKDVSDFLECYTDLIEIFGDQVTVKLSKLDSIEIEENFKI